VLPLNYFRVDTIAAAVVAADEVVIGEIDEAKVAIKVEHGHSNA
jgi:hypothetical protein